MKNNINERIFKENLSPTERAQAARNIRYIKEQLHKDYLIGLDNLKAIIGIPLCIITIVFLIYCSVTGSSSGEILADLQKSLWEWFWNLF